jgi:arsenate reductase
MLSNTFAGIAPSSAPAFIVSQLVGTGVAILAIRLLYPFGGDAAAVGVEPSGEP